MSEYGVTDKGFILKRLDAILDEVNTELSAGLGFDVSQLDEQSFFHVLNTTFCGQIADLWEAAKESYDAKYPSSASGISLDNAMQFGGVIRKKKKKTSYQIHCTGSDGTIIPAGAVIGTNTNPQILLDATEKFTISRTACNSLGIVVSAVEVGIYTVTVGENSYTYTNASVTASMKEILEGISAAIADSSINKSVADNILEITSVLSSQINAVSLSDNLTTNSVTSIGVFTTEDYGSISIPDGVINQIVSGQVGWEAVTNKLVPTYGRLTETDVELRHSYLQKCQLRSTTMIGSIVAELLSDDGNYDVASCTGYENNTDKTDEAGRPPHCIELVVEGGDETAIAQVILNKKAGGIATYGKVSVPVVTEYGDTLVINFNRPDYIYVWIKVVLHVESTFSQSNFASLVREAITDVTDSYNAGDSMLSQTFHKGIYSVISNLRYIDILAAYTSDSSKVPADSDYTSVNVYATSRQKLIISENRIEVSVNAAS